MSDEWPSQKPKIPAELQEGYEAFMTNSRDELRMFVEDLAPGWCALIIEFRKAGQQTRLGHLEAGDLQPLFKELGDSEVDERLGHTLAFLPDSKLDELILYMDPAIKAQSGWAN